ncbi:hypothetical protein GH714_043194 [Hevea brasiliensis]|uniref:Thioesterase domain-containing protein n=1 Tax=Hevea brasiliensis TaxID=3981 RepID=A0A6A6K290_HEVBR|nr:hypothetical protein GH714_043194 [Hevea brasiliensis]
MANTKNSSTTTTTVSPEEKASSSSIAAAVSKALPSQYVHEVESFFIRKGISSPLAENHKSLDFYSHLFRHLLKVNHVYNGRVSCFFSVLPAFINIFNGLHGGVTGAIAERVAIACARTVLAEDKELFLGELSMSYLSAAPLNEVCVADGSIVSSGRNLTVVAMEFKIKNTGKVNIYNGLFGGAIGAIAERVAIACARTVVAQDKELFPGELSMSYLSAAPQTEVVVVDGSVARSGRNITVVAIEFRIKKNRKLVYTARATLYHMPVAKL